MIDICDVSDRDSIKKAAEKSRKKVGDVSILVNNAGITTVSNILIHFDKRLQLLFELCWCGV